LECKKFNLIFFYQCVSYSDKPLKGRCYIELKVLNINSDKSGFYVGVGINTSGGSYSSEGFGFSTLGINANDTCGVLVDMKKLKYWFFKNGSYINQVKNLDKGAKYYYCVHNYYQGDKYQLKFPKIPKNPN
jgi:hypothetical protein